MKPTGNYLLLEVKEKEDNSLIIIPKQFKKKERKGKVLAVGRYVSIDVKIGDEVLFSAGGIKETEFGLLIPERSIQVKVRKDVGKNELKLEIPKKLKKK